MFNIYKYAFPDGVAGVIEINISKVNENYLLTLSDNGIGFNENEQKGTSMGLKLVKLLAMQINGTFEKADTEKTKFLIEFSEL